MNINITTHQHQILSSWNIHLNVIYYIFKIADFFLKDVFVLLRSSTCIFVYLIYSDLFQKSVI